MSGEKETWNSTFRNISTSDYSEQRSWLSDFVPLLKQDGLQSVLELGCGRGVDTHLLVSRGFHVTATDFSEEALRLSRNMAPEAQFCLHDLREPFPFDEHTYDGVIASLSLHYFDMPTARRIVGEIERVIRPGGLLLIRLNSAADPKALGPQQSVQRYFYTAELCRELFAGWIELQLQELTVDYFGRPKVLWQGVFRNPTLRRPDHRTND